MAIKQDNFEYSRTVPSITKELFAKAEAVLDTRILTYSDSIKRSLSLSDLNIQEKKLIAPSIHHGYVNHLFSEKTYLKRLERKRETLLEELEDDDIEGRKELRELYEKIELQKDVIEYLGITCQILRGFDYSVKNCIELGKR